MRAAAACALAACVAAADPALTWLPAPALGIGGRAYDLSGPDAYARLPPGAAADVSPAAFAASRAPAGLFVQFATDASAIYLSYTLNDTVSTVTPHATFNMNGWAGCDLFRWDDATAGWRWVAVTFNGLAAAPARRGWVLESPYFAYSAGWPVSPAPADPTLNATYRYRLHLPSWAPMGNLSVGVPTAATLAPDASWDGPVQVTYVGGGAVQGGVTGRPGMSLTQRLSRNLTLALSRAGDGGGVPVNNLGFGGGGCGLEPGLAKWVGAASAKTGAFVVDCAADMSPAAITANTAPFVTALLAARPGVPVLLVEPVAYRPGWATGGAAPDGSHNVSAQRAALRREYNALLASGAQGVYYQTGDALQAAYPAWDEPTYDGLAPMDDGLRAAADALAPVLAALLAGTAPAPTPVPPLEAAAVATAAPPRHRAQEPPSTAATITWTPAEDLTVVNRAFSPDVLPGPFARLPAAAQRVVRAPVWSLSLDSAGLAIGFSTDAPEVWLDYASGGGEFTSDAHFSATGISALDLYGWDAGTGHYRFIATTSNLTLGSDTFVGRLATGLLPPSGGKGRYLLYLPTYNYPKRLSVGVPSGAALTPDAPWPADARPVVWYGTSILQGAAAFRPGAITTSIVSRAFNTPVLNFGFSGNCYMEPDVVQFIVNATKTPAVFVLDCNPNMNVTGITERAVPVVQMVRAAWPDTPIFMAEGIREGRSWAVADDAALEDGKNAALAAAYASLTGGGMGALTYVRQPQLYSAQAWEDSPTSAGVHPMDQGMRDTAAFWVGALAGAVGGGAAGHGA
jgi:hypothetical protein